MARIIVAVLLLVPFALPAATTSAQGPTAADVLKAVAEYVDTYAEKISGVTLEEDYTLLDVSGGRVVNTRRISSDLVLLNVNGRVEALRDPFAVDSNPLRERTPRITTVLAKPSQAAWDEAQRYAGESIRYFQDELIVRLNDPMLALRFVDAANHMRAEFKIDGKKKIGGIDTVGLAFQEPKVKAPAAPNYVLPTPGHAATRGKLWVEVATGRVLKTEMSLQSDTETARIVVDYKRDATLDMWLPAAMVDTYEVTERTGAAMSNMGAGSPGVARRSFDCRASYANPKLTPIDLRVPK